MENYNVSKEAYIRTGDTLDSEAMDMRLFSGQYKIYINDDFIGEKAMSDCGNQQDTRTIGKYLASKGFSDYKIIYEGNDIKIKVNDIELAEKIKNALKQEYLIY